MNVLVIGCGHGLGKVLCEMLSEQGHKVMAGFLNEKDLRPDFFQGTGITSYHMDVTDEGTLKKAASEMRGNHIQLDAVLDVAGVLPQCDRDETLLTSSIEEFMTTMRINVAGIILTFRTFYPLMKKGGMFIAMSSDGGSFAIDSDLFPGYSISKTAATRTIQILKCTARDVDVIALHPGRMNTRMGRTTAQIEPEEAAAGICKIIDKTVRIEKGLWYVDYEGQPMPFC